MTTADSATTPHVVNCTFTGNGAGTDGGGLRSSQCDTAVTNCILWGNSDAGGSDESAQLIRYSGTVIVAHSCVQRWTGTLGGTGNIGFNPFFLDADGADDIVGTEDDDLRLAIGSPCIDAGDNSGVPADTADLDGNGDTDEPTPVDLDGAARFVDVSVRPDTGNGTAPIVDMGAYEKPEPPAEQYITLDLGDAVTMTLVKIPAGSFIMGSPESDPGHGEAEQPQRTVNISAFAIGKTEVTQAQWRAVMGTDPSSFTGDDLPVEQVSWDDCQLFCTALSELSGLTIRLPSEAEWEYACRAGNTTLYSFGDDSADLGSYAWYVDNSSSQTHDVAGKLPNAWGLYDMYGNVYEWCNDWYGETYYGQRPDPDSDPPGPESGDDRVQRGGAWYNGAGDCRSAYRMRRAPDYRYYNNGLRIAAGTE